MWGTGAPQPLEPELVTLSLLPRSQWQTLVHLDAIKVLHASCSPAAHPIATCHSTTHSAVADGAANSVAAVTVCIAISTVSLELQGHLDCKHD